MVPFAGGSHEDLQLVLSAESCLAALYLSCYKPWFAQVDPYIVRSVEARDLPQLVYVFTFGLQMPL